MTLDCDDFSTRFDRVGAWIVNYYQETRAFPVLSRNAPGDLIAALPAHAPARGRVVRCDLSRLRTLDRSRHHALESSAVLRVLRDQRGAGDGPRRSACRRARRQRDVVAHVAGRDGTRRRHVGLAARDARLAGRIFTASSTIPRRSAATPRSPRPANRSAWRFANAAWPAGATCRCCACTSPIKRTRTSRRAAIALGVGRENVIKFRSTTISACARRVGAPVSTTISRAGGDRCASVQPSARHRPRRSDPVAAIARSRMSATCGCTSTPPTPDRRRSCPEFRSLLDGATAPIRSSSTRISGCSFRSISRCFTCATPDFCAARSAWWPTI